MIDEEKLKMNLLNDEELNTIKGGENNCTKVGDTIIPDCHLSSHALVKKCIYIESYCPKGFSVSSDGSLSCDEHHITVIKE